MKASNDFFIARQKFLFSGCQFSSTIGSAVSDLSSEVSWVNRPSAAGWWSRRLGRKRQRGVVGETFKDKQAWATRRWWELRKLIDRSAAAAALEKKLPSLVQWNEEMSLRWWMLTLNDALLLKRDQNQDWLAKAGLNFQSFRRSHVQQHWQTWTSEEYHSAQINDQLTIQSSSEMYLRFRDNFLLILHFFHQTAKRGNIFGKS